MGIIPHSEALSNHCSASSFTDPNNCSSYLDIDAIRKTVEQDCVGKATCKLEDLDHFVDHNGKGFNAEECDGKTSLIYMQIACTLSNDQVVNRQKDSLFLGCVAVFIALFVLNYIDFIKKIQQNDYVEWDIKTITAGDYTIEFDITVDFY